MRPERKVFHLNASLIKPRDQHDLPAEDLHLLVVSPHAEPRRSADMPGTSSVHRGQCELQCLVYGQVGMGIEPDAFQSAPFILMCWISFHFNV